MNDKQLEEENEMLRTLLAMLIMAFEKNRLHPIMIMTDGPLEGKRVDVVQTAKNYMQANKI